MVLTGEALGEPKSADGAAEMVRVLRVVRTSAVRARAKAYTALQDLLVTAPATLRERLAGRYKDRLIQACKQLPEPETPTSPTDAMILTIMPCAQTPRQAPRWCSRNCQRDPSLDGPCPHAYHGLLSRILRVCYLHHIIQKVCIIA
jgi:hypothetical protein